ncbi:MAG: hypothetical protein WAS36_00630 [Candidatus Saccharimonadales bacterium]
MPVKSYVQQASSSLQQAVMTIDSDESELVRRYEQDIQKLKSEASDLENKRNLMAVNLAAKDDQLQTDIVRQQIISLEKEKNDKDAQAQDLERELSNQRQTMQQIKSELQSISSSIDSALGRSGLV